MLSTRAGLLAVFFLGLCACGEKPDDDTATPVGDGDGDGYVGEADCDDADPAIHPGADERCDGIDNDCDGLLDDDDDDGVVDPGTWYADEDGDGYAGLATTARACAAPAGYYAEHDDCDDGSADVHPGAEERCNLTDDDCDGRVDDDDDDVTNPTTWYIDRDGDGYGADSATTAACAQPSGFVAQGGDCDDDDVAFHPDAAEDDCTDPHDYDCDGSVAYADADADGWAACEDCDDADPAVNPAAAEVCDAIDNDCDGDTDEDDATDAPTWYADSDADGYGDAASPAAACAQPSGHVSDDTDCDDALAAVNPGATELCDGLDNDCDGTTDDGAEDAATWYADADGDGFGEAATTATACTQPTGFVADDTDCDDAQAAVNPGATELCDGVDDDCDGAVDEADAADAPTWFADADGDGFGDPADATTACTAPSDTVADDTDCDDTADTIFPGAAEHCDGTDEDCDGVDDDDAVDALTWYDDADGDGFGDPAAPTVACAAPSDTVADSADCDDGDDTIFPGADEHCDGVDEDCDGVADDGATDLLTWYADDDADGYGDAAISTEACSVPEDFVADATDCDDTRASVHPGAAEHCDGVDEDCDGATDEGAVDALTWYADDDADGYGDPTLTTAACTLPDDFVADATDCDDTDPDIHPGADEHCDGADEDCDGAVDDDAVDGDTWYADADADGYGDAAQPIVACAQPSGTVSDTTDCDDTQADVHPGATEHCDGVDEDCDGTTDEGATDLRTWYADIDADGYGDAADAAVACSPPSGRVEDATDCDDTQASVHPGADEHCDGVDEDCDGTADDDAVDAGTWFADVDGDGYGEASTASTACVAPSGTTADGTDCDDGDPGVHPGADEHCDGVDEDCDGTADDDAVDADTWYDDADGDGYGDAAGATVACTQPSDTVADATDCDDAVDTIHPGADEHCDGVDEDCDGEPDEEAVDRGTWYADADGDGYGDASTSTQACTQPSGHVADPTDCDDLDGDIHPGADEHCDGADEDCDGDVDEDAVDMGTWYADLDADGHGDATDTTTACVAPSGYVADAYDCDDTDADVYPDAEEHCDGLDTDCDGAADPSDLVTLIGGADYDDLGDALAAAAAGATLNVCPGTYFENLVIDRALTITGTAGAASTFVIAEGAGSVVMISGGPVTLEGLTLTGGTGTWDPLLSATTGGGVLVASTSPVTLADCVLTGNDVADLGGGLYAGPNTELLMEDCEITENTAGSYGGGAYLDQGAYLMASDALFSANEAGLGGGLALSYASADLMDCEVESNLGDEGAGLLFAGDSAALLTLYGTTIHDNLASASGGGIFVAYTPTLQGGWVHDNESLGGGGGVAAIDPTAGTATGATLEDLDIDDNLAASGGGLWIYRRANLTGVGITGNVATDMGGGLYAESTAGNTDLVLTIDDSDVSSNMAGGDGGGAYLLSAPMESTGTTWGTGTDDNDPDDVALDQGSGVAATYATFDDSGADFTCDFTTMVCGP
ncbi:MAG: MopE-related protein [Pseudomonadota bacterium]